MNKKVLRVLKDAYERKDLEFVVLFVLSKVKDQKFVSVKYIYDELGIPKSDTSTSFIISYLVNKKMIEKRYLVAYRMKQIGHDKYMIKTHFDMLLSRGYIPLGKTVDALEEDDCLHISENVTAELKRELDWFDEVEIVGRKALQMFAESSIHGPYKLFGKGLTQSVYRISSEGLIKLGQYEVEYGDFDLSDDVPQEFIDSVKKEFEKGERGALSELQGILKGGIVISELEGFLEKQCKVSMSAQEIVAAFDSGYPELVKEEAEKRIRIERLWRELQKLAM